MRLISFFLTTPQFLDGSKDVTRRLGWKNVKPGDRLMAVRKSQGRKRGEPIERLGEIEVTAVSRIPLWAISWVDCCREGFPDLDPDGFIAMFCKHMGCERDTTVTRIEFRRVSAGMSGKGGPIVHGHSRRKGGPSPEYNSWAAMIQRCTNPNVEKYPLYGGRGITVCPRWRRSFTSFLDDMGPKPPGTTINRKNNDGHYEPGNCEWATPKQQAANRRASVNHNSKKTRCPSGHPYAGSNVHRRPNGDRKCRECDRLRQLARRAAGR